MSLGVKKGMRNNIVFPTLSYASGNAIQQAQLRVVERTYIGGACGMSKWDLESKGKVFERYGMSAASEGVGCFVGES